MKWLTSSDKWSRFVIGFSVGAKSGDLVKSRYKSFWRTLYELYSFVSRTADSKPAVSFIYFSLSEAPWAVWPSLNLWTFSFLAGVTGTVVVTVTSRFRSEIKVSEGWGGRDQDTGVGLLNHLYHSVKVPVLYSKWIYVYSSLACSFFPFNFTENFS